eukprot:scaffold24175_cov125-Isochrysis_galbana.AAC.11
MPALAVYAFMRWSIACVPLLVCGVVGVVFARGPRAGAAGGGDVCVSALALASACVRAVRIVLLTLVVGTGSRRRSAAPRPRAIIEAPLCGRLRAPPRTHEPATSESARNTVVDTTRHDRTHAWSGAAHAAAPLSRHPLADRELRPASQTAPLSAKQRSATCAVQHFASSVVSRSATAARGLGNASGAHASPDPLQLHQRNAGSAALRPSAGCAHTRPHAAPSSRTSLLPLPSPSEVNSTRDGLWREKREQPCQCRRRAMPHRRPPPCAAGFSQWQWPRGHADAASASCTWGGKKRCCPSGLAASCLDTLPSPPCGCCPFSYHPACSLPTTRRARRIGPCGLTRLTLTRTAHCPANPDLRPGGMRRRCVH